MEEPLTLRELKRFLKTHKAIKRYVFAKECGISRFSFMRVIRGETSIDRYGDKIASIMIKYGHKET